MKKLKHLVPGIYRHFKGNLYEVIESAHQSETLSEVVVYRALYTSPEFGKNHLWVRPKEMFLESVIHKGQRIQRFTLVEQVKTRPTVGVGVIIKNDNKVLLGKRMGNHGNGTWGFPGGHLEYGENIFKCAKREVKEECGLTIAKLSYGPYVNSFFPVESRQSVTLFVVCTVKKEYLEPQPTTEMQQWIWCCWNDFPQPLFQPVVDLLLLKYDPLRSE